MSDSPTRSQTVTAIAIRWRRLRPTMHRAYVVGTEVRSNRSRRQTHRLNRKYELCCRSFIDWNRLECARCSGRAVWLRSVRRVRSDLAITNWFARLGRGGMGVVFEAVQKSLDRKVAVKVLPKSLLEEPQQLDRFEREARTAGSLHHTNIVPVFGVGSDQGFITT